jgi:hypothetical protein
MKTKTEQAESPRKHTPGPWFVAPGLGCRDIGPKTGEKRKRVTAVVCTVGIEDAEDEANANLIAAAPGLLEALKALMEKSRDFAGLHSTAWLEEHKYRRIRWEAMLDSIVQAQAALALAGGGE